MGWGSNVSVCMEIKWCLTFHPFILLSSRAWKWYPIFDKKESPDWSMIQCAATVPVSVPSKGLSGSWDQRQWFSDPFWRFNIINGSTSLMVKVNLCLNDNIILIWNILFISICALFSFRLLIRSKTRKIKRTWEIRGYFHVFASSLPSVQVFRCPLCLISEPLHWPNTDDPNTRTLPTSAGAFLLIP